MKLKKTILPLFFSIILITLLISSFINIGKSVSYYNWIQNYGFESGANFIDDSGFESGLFDKGVQYGNWSTIGTNASILTTSSYVHSGVYGLYISTNGFAWYNLTNQILGNNIVQFSFWTHGSASTYILTVRFYYSDLSTNSVNVNILSSWQMQNITSSIDGAKYLIAFKLEYNNLVCGADDFQLIVGGVDSQQVIDWNSSPWFRGGEENSILLELNPLYGYNSNSSVAIASDAWNWGIIQNINYLDSDTIHFIDLYAISDGGSYGIKINLIYSDRTWSSKIVNSTGTTEWQHYIFSGFVTPNRYVVQIQILMSFQHTGVINIDDVGLWSSLQSDKARFTWTTLPLPINSTGFIANLYQSVSYTFYGKLYDINGELTEDGSFSVSYLGGSKSGSVTNGLFNFVMPTRETASYFSEEFLIQINLGTEELQFEITINWEYSATIANPDENQGVLPNTNIPVTVFISFLLLFFIVAVPSLVFGFYCGQHNVNPLFGFVAMFNIMSMIGVISTLLNLWTLLIMIILDVVIGIYLFEHRGMG